MESIMSDSPSPEAHLGATYTLGIDFGTSHASLACRRHDWEDPVVIDNWPSGRTPLGDMTWAQVPTAIRYSTEPLPGLSGVSRNKASILASNLGQAAFGYEAAFNKQRLRKTSLQSQILIQFTKLLFENRAETVAVREELRPDLERLKAAGIITEDEDVTVHMFRYLLRHAEMMMEVHWGYDKTIDIVEFVLAVPSAWRTGAVLGLQQCLSKASREEEFGNSESVILAPEVECATRALVEKGFVGLKDSPAVLVVDMGGGTVDLGLYQLAITKFANGRSKTSLKAEPVASRGGCYGGYYFNMHLKHYLQKAFENEYYLDALGETLEARIEKCLLAFEMEGKRTWGLPSSDSPETATLFFHIPGLWTGEDRETSLPSAQQLPIDARFGPSWFEIPNDDTLKQIFLPNLGKIKELMFGMLNSARLEHGIFVKKALLLGGGANCPIILKYMKHYISEYALSINRDVSLFDFPKGKGPEVENCAIGAALFARDHAQALPKRVIASIGYLRHDFVEERGQKSLEHWEAYYRPSWDDQPTKICPDSGAKIIEDALEWICKAGQGPYGPGHTFKPVVFIHSFDKDWYDECDNGKPRPMICRQVFYRSDSATESGYQVTHARNHDIKILGEMSIDVTRFRSKIANVRDLEDVVGEGGNRRRKKVYRFILRLELTISDGRNLSWEAFIGNNQIQAGNISMAAAFAVGD